MILPNIETFIGCESSFEEASIVRHLIRRQVFVRAQDSVRQLCVMRVSDLKLTVHIRTETLWISVYLTAGI